MTFLSYLLFNMEEHLDLLVLMVTSSSYLGDGLHSELECLRYQKLDKLKEANESAKLEEWYCDGPVIHMSVLDVTDLGA